MPDGAHLTSIEALDAFRNHLVVYLSKARPLLEDASDEVVRTRVWLQDDRRTFWEQQARRRTRVLEQAQQDLLSVRLSNLREATAAEQQAVQKARRALDEAEDKLRAVKRWSRDFDSRTGPLLKQLEKLHTLLAQDMPKAAAQLAEFLRLLDAYTSVKPAAAETPAATAPPADAAASSGTPSAPPPPAGGPS